MRTGMITVMALLATATSGAAELDVAHCRFPEPPAVAQGSEASEAEMRRSRAAVMAFVADTRTSLECLLAVEESLDDDLTREQRGELYDTYNSGRDQMLAVIDQFNEQLEVYGNR